MMIRGLSLARQVGIFVALVLLVELVTAAPSGWTNVQVIKGQKNIENRRSRTLARVLKSLPSQYKLSFEFYAKKNGGKWGNVIQMTPGGRKAKVWGEHIATVFYNDGQQEMLVLYDGKPHKVKNLGTDKWHKVELSLMKERGGYRQKLVVNGQTQASEEVMDAKSYKDVAVLSSAPWYNSVHGFIQNLNISFKR